jgi:hypothetical protein
MWLGHWRATGYPLAGVPVMSNLKRRQVWD